MSKPPKCEECMYWLEDGRNKTNSSKKRGECRKSLPSLGPNGYGYWPLTAYSEFCYAGAPKENDGVQELLKG